MLETNRDGEVVVSCVVKGGSAFEHGINEVLSHVLYQHRRCCCFGAMTRDLSMCWRASVISNGHDV